MYKVILAAALVLTVVVLGYVGAKSVEAKPIVGASESCIVDDGPQVDNKDNPRDDCMHRMHTHPIGESCWKIFGWKVRCKTIWSGLHTHCKGS